MHASRPEPDITTQHHVQNEAHESQEEILHSLPCCLILGFVT
jgi:hypothetical protein